ncbi:PREDICTED: sialic acid-binding Ig-like lectin 5, partial [Myotis davidii]|uniref:sialic acid-binding Ig-like lectin 5 n=1 Tax=Myotis davidii TaxID=225400 RepID=UPI0007679BC6
NLYTYWYRDGDNPDYAAPVASSNRNKQVKKETQGRFLLADPTTNNCSLSIRDARRSDTGRYFFRLEIEYPEYNNYLGYIQRYKFQVYSYREKMLDLQVTEKPHIRMRELLESGHPTELACSLPGACEGGRPLTFSWAGAAVDSLDPQTLRSSVLTFTPRPRDHGTSLTCQVKREGSRWSTQRTIQLNVSYAPENLTIGVSFRNDTAFKNLQNTSLSILEGEALRLRCEADSNPPAELTILVLTSPLRVKARRRQAAGRPKVRNDEEPVMGTVTRGSQEKLGPDRPPDQAPPAKDAPPSGEQQELYYANLSFYEMKTRESQNLEATGSPEYSEIKRAGK